MADLDDFFAKKDKKKSKGKKFTTVDQVAKKLEDTSKKPLDVKPKKDKEKLGQDGENTSNNLQEDDEWKEFEEEKKDYSGLKIQNMQLNENEEGMGGGGDDDDDEDGEGGEGGGRRAAGPWKMPVTQENVAENDSDEEDEPPPEPAPKRSEQKETSSYVPPHLRNAAPSSGPQQNQRVKSKIAPDITNEAYFPTLSAAAAAEPAGPWGKKGRRDDERGFEDVRNSKSHSSRVETGRPGATTSSTGRVTVENKWNALRDTDQS